MYVERYRVLVLGEGPLNGSFDQENPKIPTGHAYQQSLANIRPFTEACDSVLVTLATSEAQPEGLPSGFQGVKASRWADLEATVEYLRDMGVDAVSLATGPTGRRHPEVLEATFQTLSDFGVAWFGAGRTLQEARMPYRLKLPDRVGGGEFHFHGSSHRSTRNEEDLGAFATEDSSGCAPLSVAEMPWARLAETQDHTFQIALPHWGLNHGWRGRDQFQLAHRYLRKDYDLVLGQGADNLQEVHRKQQRWIVYGIGNSSFQSRDVRRHPKEDSVLPYSFCAVLEVLCQGSERWVQLKLYPVYSINCTTDHWRVPINKADFDRVLKTLRSRPERPWRFDNPAQRAGQDELGFFLSLDLGAWPHDERPSRLEPIIKSGDPGDWPTRGPSSDVEDKVMALNKTVGSGMLALNAEARGGTSTWSPENIALIAAGDRRFVAYQFMAHESILGARICIDKVLSASFFEKAGVNTPQTVAVDTVDEAVQAASVISGPVVVKPRKGLQSRGVSTGLVTDDEVREAFAFAHEHGPEVIVQQHIIASEELRVMASPSETVAVIKRVLPHVVGDGVSTVGQLIEDKNRQRSLNPSLRNSRLIPIDAHTRRHLSQNNYSLDSVLQIGETITVRNIAALSVGADAHQALENSDPAVKNIGAAAVAAIPGLGWGGVDLIIEKGTEEPYVIEINTNAAYGAALFPTYGAPLDVAEKVWDLRYAATVPEIRTPPERPAPLSAPNFLARKRDTTPTNGVLRFSKLFTDSLRRQNFQVRHVGSRVLNILSPENKESWVTSTGFTEADPYVVALLMRRHRRVQGLLDVAGIPSPRGREITSIKGLRDFAAGLAADILAFPLNKSWKGPHVYVLTVDELLKTHLFQTSMWIQSRPQGERFRVLATTKGAWVVTTRSAGSVLLSEASINVVSDLATKAVRAIPELRWAAVDVLVDPNDHRENLLGSVSVEGLTIAPRFSTDENIIAGDFDAFVRQMVDSSHTRSRLDE